MTLSVSSNQSAVNRMHTIIDKANAMIVSPDYDKV